MIDVPREVYSDYGNGTLIPYSAISYANGPGFFDHYLDESERLVRGRVTPDWRQMDYMGRQIYYVKNAPLWPVWRWVQGDGRVTRLALFSLHTVGLLNPSHSAPQAHSRGALGGPDPGGLQPRGLPPASHDATQGLVC